MANTIKVPWKTLVFYRNCLPSAHAAIYDAIYDGLCSWKEEIPVPSGASFSEVADIYTMVIRDHPMLFHVRSSTVRGAVGRTITVYPDYVMTPARFAEAERQVSGFLTRCKKQTAEYNAFEKARILHDSMVRHIVYYGIHEDKSHSVLGAILDRKGVCESIAKAYKLTCDVCLVPCIVVFGDGSESDGRNAPEENHAWNMVQLDGKWFNVDATNDAVLSEYAETGSIRYDYFCRSDRVIAGDHRVITRYKPRSLQDFSMYRLRKQVVGSQADADRVIGGFVGAGVLSFSFEYAPDGAAGDRLERWIGEALSRKAKAYSSYTLSMNEICGVAAVSLQK